ncbi:MAG: hypothetical protein LBP23_02430 [Treponema sp.]|nr:hypothetical protein [Treponema sp.]
MKRLCIVLAVFLAGHGALHGMPESVSWEVDYVIRDAVDVTGNKYISYQGWLPSVLTFVNDDGSVTVCTSSGESAETTWVYEYSIDLKEQKTMHFENELGQLGAFTKDGEGNYYFFYGSRAADKNAENMAMVKRGREGEKIKVYKLKANAPKSMDGIRVPFDAGTCRLELSGSLLAVYFAREMFSGHQASYGFVLDKDTFERIDRGAATHPRMGDNTQMPYVSHSFNQFILPCEGGFLFADHGDAYPRCFTFAKFQNGSNTKRLDAFKFPGQIGQNATYAEMGGLAKTQEGGMFAGTYGKAANASRNVFVLFLDENLSSCTAPVWLTAYSKEDGHAGHPKIAALDAGRYLLLWERYAFSTQPANRVGQGPTGYVSTHMLVINEKGEPLSDTGEMQGVRLNINDTLRYNRRNGKVYWAVTGSNKSVTLYALDTGQR